MAQVLTLAEIKALVRTIPDFPKPGIQFRDLTTLMGDGPGFASCVHHLAQRAGELAIHAIAGIEARGFVFGAALAAQMGVGFVPIRKEGKLPVAAIGIDYALEYGSDRLEMDPMAVGSGQSVLIVDDLIATGGTAMAAAQLIRQAGARVDHALFVADLPDLGGAQLLRDAGISVQALMAFEGD